VPEKTLQQVTGRYQRSSDDYGATFDSLSHCSGNWHRPAASDLAV